MGTMPRDPSLRAVVEAAQRGDHAAWSELVARFQDFAVGMAVACSGDWDAAPDAAQEAFGTRVPQTRRPRGAGRLPGLVRHPGAHRVLAPHAREAARGCVARRRRRRRTRASAIPRARCRRRRAAITSVLAIEALPEPERAVDRAALPRRSHLSRTRGVPRHQRRRREEAGVHRPPTTGGDASHGDRRARPRPGLRVPIGSAPRSCSSSRSAIATSTPSRDSSGPIPRSSTRPKTGRRTKRSRPGCSSRSRAARRR